jgi:nucleoid-associated protein YgaU
MPFSRYRNRTLIRNDAPEYQKILEDRDLNFIVQFSSPTLKELRVRDLEAVTVETHTWKAGDRYFKLAHQYYGDPTFWWVIAYFNNAPLETDLSLGQNILIPLPLGEIIAAMGV